MCTDSFIDECKCVVKMWLSFRENLLGLSVAKKRESCHGCVTIRPV